jgi:hypothetical protein
MFCFLFITEGGIVGEFDEANQGLFMPLWIALSMMIY